METKICIGLLSNRGFKGETVMSLMRLLNESKEFSFHFAFIGSGYTIAENRNFLAVQAVKNNCDYLLMVDDDMMFPPETLKLLISRNKDIIGVPYNVRALSKPDEKPGDRHNVTYFPEGDMPDPPEGEPIEVMAVGTGVMLVKTDVFKKLTQPYFSFDTYENGMTKVGEDSWFCYKAARSGYKIFCERTLTGLGHIGQYIY